MSQHQQVNTDVYHENMKLKDEITSLREALSDMVEQQLPTSHPNDRQLYLED
jgi:hypothetical protein